MPCPLDAGVLISQILLNVIAAVLVGLQKNFGFAEKVSAAPGAPPLSRGDAECVRAFLRYPGAQGALVSMQSQEITDDNSRMVSGLVHPIKRCS